MQHSNRYQYLIHLQYLGFRFSGWQKQPNGKTIQGMLDKTLCFVLGHSNFKTLASGRTDAKVSAHHTLCELFVREKIEISSFLDLLNKNLPPDIKVLKIQPSAENFNIIQDITSKVYCYFFSFGDKFHPFCAPFMTHQDGPLDIEKMQAGAKLFTGKHNFINYCYKDGNNPKSEYFKTVNACDIKRNDIYEANFFPEHCYYLQVEGKGFGRHQVRMMMGMLFKLGLNQVTHEQVQETLNGSVLDTQDYIAPASGLMLKQVNIS